MSFEISMGMLYKFTILANDFLVAAVREIGYLKYDFVQILCSKILVKPSKSLRKLPRVQHLSAQLSATLRNEDDEVTWIRRT